MPEPRLGDTHAANPTPRTESASRDEATEYERVPLRANPDVVFETLGADAAVVLVAEFDVSFAAMIDTFLRSPLRHVVRTHDRSTTWKALLSLYPDLVILPSDSHALPIL